MSKTKKILQRYSFLIGGLFFYCIFNFGKWSTKIREYDFDDLPKDALLAVFVVGLLTFLGLKAFRQNAKNLKKSSKSEMDFFDTLDWSEANNHFNCVHPTKSPLFWEAILLAVVYSVMIGVFYFFSDDIKLPKDAFFIIILTPLFLFFCYCIYWFKYKESKHRENIKKFIREERPDLLKNLDGEESFLEKDMKKKASKD